AIMEMRGCSTKPFKVNLCSYIVMVLVMVCTKFSRIRLCFMKLKLFPTFFIYFLNLWFENVYLNPLLKLKLIVVSQQNIVNTLLSALSFHCPHIPLSDCASSNYLLDSISYIYC